MATQTIGIIVNGASGRIGSTQHLANALVPIIAGGGLALGDDRLLPRLLLVGRDRDRLAAVARAHNIADWTTDLDAALADPAYAIFFDAAATQQRVAVLERALAAGKHIYSEKPVAPTATQGLALLRSAQMRGLKHGAVEDKVHLPGLQKLTALVDSGALGRIVGFRLEFGWWVFDGSDRPCQRPSWNYRAGGGGLILDMYPHWRYVIERIVGRIVRVVSSAWIATPERIDEQGAPYAVAVEDSASTLVELENGAFGTILSSWATRVRRDDLLTLQVDGTEGSAVAGLHQCHVQSAGETPTIAPFQRHEGHRRRLSRRLASGAAARELLQPLPRRLGAVSASRYDRRAPDLRLRRRHPRRPLRRGLPPQHAGADLDHVPERERAVGHAAAADLPMAAFTRGMTSSAINCMERLLSAGSTQSIPA
jgi:predicted dehydrogenase